MNPKVSITVVSCNRKDNLKKCLDSLLNLDYTNYEIFVVDNGSKDGSIEMIRRDYPQIKLFCNERNLGVVVAHNMGVKNSDGKYFIRVDDDVELDRNFIKELVKVMENDKKIGIAGGKIYWHRTNKLWCVGGKINYITGKTITLGEGEDDKGQYNKIADVDYIGCCMFVRRELFNNFGLLDTAFSPVYYEDVEFNTRIRKGKYKIVYVPTAIAYHNQQPRTPSIKRVIMFQTHRLKFLIRHFGYRSVVN
jgi:hypothetical protein